MPLTRTQKKFIKKNIKILSLDKISLKLGLSKKEILDFLKNNWRKDKYEKYLQSRGDDGANGPENSGIREQTTKGFFAKNGKIFLFLALIVAAVYFNSLGNAFISDDIASIKDNPDIGNISYFWRAPYYNISLRLVINYLLFHLFGANPAPFRLFNILVHTGSAWMLYLIMSFFYRRPIPLFVAGLFAVHPLLTESVSWISGGPYSNSGFFIFLSLFSYIFYTKNKKLFWYFSSFAGFLFALLISQKVFVFPMVVILYEILFGDFAANWKRLLPFAGLSGFWTLNLIGLMGERISTLQNTFYVRPGIDNPLIQLPIAISSYLELSFWPQRMTFYHSEMVFGAIEFSIRAAATLIFIGVWIAAFKKDKKLFFWLSFFVICLLPTLTPFRISWVVAERYINPAIAGVFLAMALLVKRLADQLKIKKLEYIIFAILIIFFGAYTVARNAEWKDPDNFWLITGRYSPSSYQNHNNIADVYFRRKDYENAERELKIAIALKNNYGDAYHNLANVYYVTKRYDLAIENYRRSISFNPNIWQSHQNLSVIYFEKGDFFLAKQEIDEAIKINPKNDDLYLSLGIIYARLNEPGKAKEALEKAVALNPANEKAKQGLESLR